jgi:hypothetical protein
MGISNVFPRLPEVDVSTATTLIFLFYLSLTTGSNDRKFQTPIAHLKSAIYHPWKFGDSIFHVYLIYPDELQIKDHHRIWKICFISRYFTFNCDSNGRLTTTLYDKRDDFYFAIVNFPLLCSNIRLSPAYSVYTSQLIR